MSANEDEKKATLARFALAASADIANNIGMNHKLHTRSA